MVVTISWKSAKQSTLGRQSNRLIKSAQGFQRKIVKKWNPDIHEPILSIVLSLIGTNKSASKECTAITLDRLLHAVIFVEQEGGS
jgi:hypothetical protein